MIDGGSPLNNDYGYKNKRSEYRYYKYIRNLLAILSINCDSILDVGSRGMDYISFLPIKEKASIDLEIPLEKDGIESIKGDFLKYEFKKSYDIVCCFQVLEHIEDENVYAFAKRLIEVGKIVVVSVPYMWDKGICKWHCQDPVSIDKLISWFGRPPVFVQNIYDDLGRMVAIFIDEKLTCTVNEINDALFFDFMPYDLEGEMKNR